MNNKRYTAISLALAFSILFGQVLYGQHTSVITGRKTDQTAPAVLSGNYIKNEVIAGFKNGDTGLISASPYNRYFKKLKAKIKSIGAADVLLKDGVTVKQAVLALMGDPNISLIQPNYIYKSQSLSQDPRSGDQWGLENDGQPVNSLVGTSGMDINAAKAWTVTKGSPSVIVADIDTGIDINHPDLKDNIWVNKKEIPGNGIDDDGNGYVDDVNGWNAAENNGNVYDPSRDESHGTHVSGIIAAEMNSIGTVGVAPKVTIMPVRVGTGSDITTDRILAGIDYADKNGAEIANLSMYGAYDPAIEKRVKKSKMLFVFAAGNEGYDIDSKNTDPDTYDRDNIITVAAVDANGNLPSFSDWGEKSVDVAAPGVNILSTIPKGNSANYDQAYGYLDGTSMAAPFVTGVAALLMSNGITDARVIKDRIIASCKKLDSLEGKVVSGGMVDAYAALTYDQSAEIPGDALNAKNSGTLGNGKSDRVYYVDLNAGANITLSLTGGSANNNDDLYLYRPDTAAVGSTKNLATSSANAGSNESINYTAPVSGRYYVDVNCAGGSGDFSLSYKMQAQNSSVVTEDSSPALDLTGSAQTEHAKSYSGGSELMLYSKGGIHYAFEGSGISWVGEKNADQGIADVYIDGTFSAEVDLYSATPQYQQQLFSKSLVAGKHTIDVQWTGTCHIGAQSNKINLDYFKSTVNSGMAGPTGLTATSDLNGISLSFYKLTNASVTGYKIYRSTDGVKYSCISTVDYKTPDSTYYYSDNVNSDQFGFVNTMYYYKVTAVTSPGAESAFSDTVTACPLMPNTCETIHPGSDKLTYTGAWTKTISASENAACSTTQPNASVSVQITGVALEIEHESDQGTINFKMDNQNYDVSLLGDMYAQVFQNRELNQTLNLTCLSGKFTLTDLYVYDNNPDYPSTLENLSASNGNKAVELNWKADSDGNLKGYNIYRSIDNVSFEKINSAPVTDPKYTDTAVESGSTYYYTVTAVNNDGKECRLKSSGVAEIQYNVTTNVNPPVITIAPFAKSPTNKNITVTATTDRGTLNAESHTFTKNGSFVFIATDDAGNVTKKTVTITNIDKTPPTIVVRDTAKAVIHNGATAKKNVVVTSSGYSTRSVKYNGKLIAWPLSNTFSKNGSYTILAADSAGNTCAASFKIKK